LAGDEVGVGETMEVDKTRFVEKELSEESKVPDN